MFYTTDLILTEQGEIQRKISGLVSHPVPLGHFDIKGDFQGLPARTRAHELEQIGYLAKRWIEYKKVLDLQNDKEYEGEHFSVALSVGRDGIPVLHVDTPNLDEDPDGPICRIHLNDEPIYENPPLSPEDN